MNFDVPKDTGSEQQQEVVKKQKELTEVFSRGYISKVREIISLLTPEQIQTPEIQATALKQFTKALSKYRRVSSAQKIIDLNILTPEQIQTPETQTLTLERLEEYLYEGYPISSIQEIIDLNILTPEQIQSALKARFTECLAKGDVSDVQKIIDLNILTSEQIQSAVQQGLQYHLTTGEEGDVEYVQEIINFGILTPEQVSEVVQERFENAFVERNLRLAEEIVDLNILTPEQSKEVFRSFLITDPQVVYDCYSTFVDNLADFQEFLSEEEQQIFVSLQEAKNFFELRNEWDKEKVEAVFLRRMELDLSFRAESKEIFAQGTETFGQSRMVEYVATERATPHDVLFAFPQIQELQQLSGLSPQEFYNNILAQVAQDKSVYQEGTAYHALNTITQSFNKDIAGILLLTKELDSLPKIQELCQFFGDESQVFASWNALKKYSALTQILERRELLEQLVALKRTGKERLAAYVEELAFSSTSKVDMSAVMEFWQRPETFLAREATYGNEDWHDQLKPSNYFKQYRLDLSAAEMRDALVEGKMDTWSAIRPLEIRYTLPLYEGMPPVLNEELQKALGSQKEGVPGAAKNVKKLFNELQKICKREGLELSAILKGTDTLTPEMQGDLREHLYHKDYGIKKPKFKEAQFMARIGAKSDPSVVLAGNDTACCMPFGDGKNNGYMFNPNTAQFVVQQVMGNGRLRTIAQSVITKDRNIEKNVATVVSGLINQKYGDLSDILPEGVLKKSEAYLACDSVEVSPNYQNRAEYDAVIRTLYQDFFYEYLQRYGEEDDLNQERLVGGMEASYGLRGVETVPNTFLPQALLSYSDKVGEQVLFPKVSDQTQYGLTKTVQVFEGHQVISEGKREKGVSALTFEDALEVGYIEGKAYDGLGMQEGITSMQNALIAKDISNAAKDRPNMSFKYTQSDGTVQGYLLAYETSVSAYSSSYDDDYDYDEAEQTTVGQPELYIRDLAVRKEGSKVAGGRLIKAMMDEYEKVYLSGEKQPIALSAEMRESTSFVLLDKMVEELNKRAEQYGYEFKIEGDQENYGDSNALHSIRVVPFQKY